MGNFGKRTRLLLAGAIVTSLPGIAAAQTGDPASAAAPAADQALPDDIVVTGEKLGAGKGRATFVLGKDDIADRPLGADITQSLNKVPGVKVSTGDARGGSFSFELFLRGLNKEQVGLTLDGIPTGDARFNGGSPPQRFIEASNIGSIVVSQSAGDIGAPSRFALGGFIDFRTDDPHSELGATVEGGYGSDNFTREFVRIDTGELAHGLSAYGSFSHQYNDIWAGPNARHASRDHAEFKVAKIFDDGSFLKARISYNRQFDNDFNIVTLPQFQSNGHSDFLNDTLTGIPARDALYGGTFGGGRKDFLAYVNAGAQITDDVLVTFNPYYQTLDGYSLSYQNRHRQLAGTDPYAVTGYDAIGGAIRPALTTTSNPNVVGGPADMRVTPRDRERYGATAEMKITNLLPRNSVRIGAWFDGGVSTEERDFYPIIPSTTTLAWQSGTPSFVQYLRSTSIETIMVYGQDSIAIIPDKLRLDAGVAWFNVHYKAKSPLEYSARLSFSQNSPVLPKLSISYKPFDHVELFGGYAKNFSGISEDAFLGSTAKIDPALLKPLQSENFDGGVRFTYGRFALSAQGFHVNLHNLVGVIPNDPTVTDPFEIQRGNIATRVANIKGETSRGVELTGFASFKLVDFYASYSYQDARYADAVAGSADRKALASVGVIAGTGVRDIPRHSAYGEITLKPATGLRIQVNSRYVGDRVGADIISPAFQEIAVEQIPGYVLFGGSIRYTLSKLGPLHGTTIQLNVDNVFDKAYLGSVSSATATATETGLPGRSLGRYFVGAPRTLTLSVQTHF